MARIGSGSLCQIHVLQNWLEAGAVLHADHHCAAAFDQLQDPFRAVHQRDTGQQDTDGAGATHVLRGTAERRRVLRSLDMEWDRLRRS